MFPIRCRFPRFPENSPYRLKPQCLQLAFRRVLSSGASLSDKASLREERHQLEQERQRVLDNARFLTCSLYRRIIRSIRVIRPGNEQDDLEFQERERKEREKEEHPDIRLRSMLTALPPTNRADELRSRAEYYLEYARENVHQESSVLDPADEWNDGHIARFLHYLKEGEKHRRWLLKDMKFQDPYRRAFDQSATEQFEKHALDYIAKAADLKLREELTSEEYQRHKQRLAEDKAMHGSDDDDDSEEWPDDDDDSEDHLAEWLRNNKKRPF